MRNHFSASPRYRDALGWLAGGKDRKTRLDRNEADGERRREKERKKDREVAERWRGSSLEASCSPPEGGNAFPPSLYTSSYLLVLLIASV